MTSIIQSDARLGFALAYVGNVVDINGDASKDLTDDGKQLIARVHNRYLHIAESPHGELFKNIPSSSCSGKSPFLLDNVDFYVAFLLVGIDEDNNEYHAKIVKHLNDCFWCFELFTDVLRDFFHASQKFKN